MSEAPISPRATRTVRSARFTPLRVAFIGSTSRGLATLFEHKRDTVPLPPVRDAPDPLSCRAVRRLKVAGEPVQYLQFRARADDVSRWLRQREPFHQARERHFSLHLEEGVKRGECSA